MKNKILGMTFLTLILSANSFADQNLKLEPQNGQVEFTAKGPLVRVKGKGEGAFGELKIKNGKASGVLSLNLSSLKTGISLRDEHMKNKYLQVDLHPIAKLKLENLELPQNLKGKGKFKGLLSLHGLSKEISGTLKLKGVKKGFVQVSAEFKIEFSEFGIELPSFKLVSVGEEIKINVKSRVAVLDHSKEEKTASL